MRIKMHAIIIFCILIIFPGIALSSGAWDIEPEIPNYDSFWKQIDSYNKNTSPEKYDRIIDLAYRLKKKYPDRHEPLLWMAWAYQQKAYHGNNSDRNQHLRTAVSYAFQSYKINKNLKSRLIFAASMGGFKNIDEIKKLHGKWMEESFPLPSGRELPDMPAYPEWNTAAKYWDKRSDINSAHGAVKLFKDMAAKNQRDCYAQMWACRSLYYLARWYELDNKIEKSLLYYTEGAAYGKKALSVAPDYVPAHFWYFLTFAKSIEHGPYYEIVYNSKYLADMVIFCCKKNCIYFYCAPLMVTSSVFSKEGDLTRGILELFGVSSDDILKSIDAAEICYPSCLNIPVTRAEFYFNIGQKEKARKMLEEILKRNPEENKLHAAENYLALKHAKNMLSSIE